MVLEMLTGGGLVAIGWLIGRFGPARRRTPAPPKPICGCGHALAYHNPTNGICRAEDIEDDVWDEKAHRHVTKAVRCLCLQYTGPTPLPTVYAPEVTG